MANGPADISWSMAWSLMTSDISEILHCTVLFNGDSIFNLLSASFPINMRLMSFAHGCINSIAIVCGSLALAIRKYTWKDAFTAAPYRCQNTMEVPIEIASSNLPLAQKMVKLSLCSHYISILNAVWVLMVSWIRAKESACTVHSVVFQCHQRRYGQIYILNMISKELHFFVITSWSFTTSTF